MPGYVDVHQHLWPPALLEQLRRRAEPPMLRGWTLYTAGEAPFEVRAADHDPLARRAAEQGASRALVSLSSPLGIEYLPPEQAAPLLAAWHDGARALGAPFGAWAAVTQHEPDLAGLDALLDAGFAGLQVPAEALATPRALELLAPTLLRCERRGRPVLVHPGPARPPGPVPSWWAPVVDYPAQLQAAWWSWQQAGRSLLPGLRICFVAGAGLAPLHHERHAARSGERPAVDRDVFVEISSYGRQAIDALTRALGIDVVVFGTDRPYAGAGPRPAEYLGAAAHRALTETNPARLLEGDQS